MSRAPIPREAIIAQFQAVVQKLGHVPTSAEWIALPGTVSIPTIARRFERQPGAPKGVFNALVIAAGYDPPARMNTRVDTSGTCADCGAPTKNAPSGQCRSCAGTRTGHANAGRVRVRGAASPAWKGDKAGPRQTAPRSRPSEEEREDTSASIRSGGLVDDRRVP